MSKVIDKTNRNLQEVPFFFKGQDHTHTSIDSIMCAAFGVEKMRIRVPHVKAKDIKVGQKYWYRGMGDSMFNLRTELITVTHIRSGVVFYASSIDKGELHFPIGCYMSERLDPFEFETSSNPQYFEYVSFSDKTKIIYKNVL